MTKTYKVNDRVEHDIFGKGTVIEVENRSSNLICSDDIVVVKFDKPKLVDTDSTMYSNEPIDVRRFTTATLNEHDPDTWEDLLDDEEVK